MSDATPAAPSDRAGRPSHLRLQNLIFLGMGLGLAGGLSLNLLGWGPEAAAAAAPVGALFIRLLKMLMVPLVFTSIVTGMTGVGDPRRLGRLGLKTLAYYLATTALAVVVGLSLVNLIRPGEGAEVATGGEIAQTAPTSLGEIVTGIVPENIVAALAQSDVLSIIFFALLLGFALAVIEEEKGRPVRALFDSLFAVVMKITGWIMWTAPLGVAALMFQTAAEMGIDDLLLLLGYVLTVVLGLGLHALVTLPLLLALVGRANPWRYVRDMAPAVATAFSTASSSASLPVTLDCIEHRAGVSNRVASFVLPLGATVNMDGTALYEAVAALFIAQYLGIDLSFGQQVVIFLTATLAAIGAAGVPSAGLVTMVLVLDAVGLPEKGIVYVVAVDRLLDMFRTAVNVWGDAVGAKIIARSEESTADEPTAATRPR